MGRKKKKPVKPWCWYCNREFDDDKILVQHQRAKHFKCPFCHKKLYSGPGLTVHCIQVHKETLDKIPEALPNKNSVDIDIYGMQGIPEEDIREHERLKRGDSGNVKAQESGQPQQQNKNQSQDTVHQSSMTAMQAAMFHHAMGLGSMPANFQMPPGMSPGLPVSFPPPGFPTMSMHPGMPPPLGYPPGMLQAGLPNALAQHMGFPPPPPLGPMPSTSGAIPPPPPMSGVSHLIGVPPPHYPPPPPTSSSNRTISSLGRGSNDSNYPSRQHQSYRSQATPTTSSRDQESSNFSKSSATSSVTTIAKPASTTVSKVDSQSSMGFDDFIEIPGSKSRIMHPNRDLSLEEMRLKLKRYKTY